MERENWSLKNGISWREKAVNERIQSCIKELLIERVAKKKEKVREKGGEKDN